MLRVGDNATPFDDAVASVVHVHLEAMASSYFIEVVYGATTLAATGLRDQTVKPCSRSLSSLSSC